MVTGRAGRGMLLAAACLAAACGGDDPPEVVVPIGTAPGATVPDALATTAEAELNVEFVHLGASREGLVDIESAPVGGLYAVYRHGEIALLDADGEQQLVALRLDDVLDDDIEQGLLAVEIGAGGTRAYVNYTATAGDGWDAGDSRLVEYRVAADGSFDVATARTVLVVPSTFDKHNSHELELGPDGYLYVGVGDGSVANDPNRRALDLGTLRGKILRIDPTAPPNALAPADNPFVDTDGARPEIWAYGLRNPWRFTFDEETGDLWITDVGQAGNEEVNVARSGRGGHAGRGSSFGWSAFEGSSRHNRDQPGDGHVEPVYTYHHDRGRCAIVGAAVYRAEKLSALDGAFVFGDFCSGEIWAIGTGPIGVARQLGVVPQASAVRLVDGELYVLSLGQGLFRAETR